MKRCSEPCVEPDALAPSSQIVSPGCRYFKTSRTRSSFSRTSLAIPAMSGLSVSVSTVMGP